MGGIELDDEEWKQIIAEVDTNNDGKVANLPSASFSYHALS